MFDKMKQLNELRKLRAQALEMQKQLAAEKLEVEEGGIRVVVSGDQEIHEIEINGEGNKDLVAVLNKAIKKSQKQAAQKLAQMSGGLGNLTGMLGG